MRYLTPEGSEDIICNVQYITCTLCLLLVHYMSTHIIVAYLYNDTVCIFRVVKVLNSSTTTQSVLLLLTVTLPVYGVLAYRSCFILMIGPYSSM